MRPAARWMTGLGALTVGFLPGLAATPAWADTAPSAVLATNWYWQEQDNITPAGAPAGIPQGAPGQASGIPDGDLGVSYTNQVDKVAALNFDLSALPKNATVQQFAVTMPLDASAHNLANGTPSVAACPAIDTFTPGPGPTSFSKVPPQGSTGCVNGKYDAAKQAYTFDLAQIATNWAAGAPADGVVIQPKPGDNTPFNYAFTGAKDITVSLSYAPVAPAPTSPTAPPAVPPVDTSGAGAALPPSSFSGAAPLALTAPAADLPMTAPAPQVQAPAGPVVAAPAASVGAAPTIDALRPDGQFWLALLGLAVLLVLAGLVLGDPLTPVPLDPRRRRFANVVRSRAAASSAVGAGTGTAAPRPTGRAHPA